MKKIVLTFLYICLLFLTLTACGSKKETPEPKEQPPQGEMFLETAAKNSDQVKHVQEVLKQAETPNPALDAAMNAH